MNFLKRFFKKEEKKTEVKEKRVFSTDFVVTDNSLEIAARVEQITAPPAKEHLMNRGTMDALPAFKLSPAPAGINEASFGWYVSQSFIGYQTAAIIAQQWLVSKACLMPAQDAMRKGYEITVNDGADLGEAETEILDAMRKGDVAYNLNKNLVELIQMGRIFGIRIAMFVVDYDDPEDYAKPFNLDGVKPGSYKGISQVDPYWITPQLDGEAAGDPGSIYFYEPTWWRITGQLIHRSHLIIYRTEEVPDILKPSYLYGGVPIPQKVYERVYAAERTANEAPMLAMTKRMNVIKCDMAQALANQGVFQQKMAQQVFLRDNYGVKTINEDEEYMQFDTSLAELDAVIMTQYQIVAAACNVPAVKLLGTSPKGFNATGGHEEASYHEFLESLQETGMTQLVERHHQLLIRSEIMPMFNLKYPIETCIKWNKLDAMTEEEQALVNKAKAETGAALVNSGAIDGIDERKRIIADPTSGYNGLIHDEIEIVQSEPVELENA